jgi:hypothetical protein
MFQIKGVLRAHHINFISRNRSRYDYPIPKMSMRVQDVDRAHIEHNNLQTNVVMVLEPHFKNI